MQSYLGTCWCLYLWCKIKFRNICTSERIEDAHYNSQAGPSNANGWTRMGNSFLRALRGWNSGRNSAQIYRKLQAETRCQPTARKMGKRGGRCTNSQRRLVGGGTRTEDETATRHWWHPSRRRRKYEDSHSAKVTEWLILISYLRNVMLRVILSRIQKRRQKN